MKNTVLYYIEIQLLFKKELSALQVMEKYDISFRTLQRYIKNNEKFSMISDNIVKSSEVKNQFDYKSLDNLKFKIAIYLLDPTNKASDISSHFFISKSTAFDIYNEFLNSKEYYFETIRTYFYPYCKIEFYEYIGNVHDKKIEYQNNKFVTLIQEIVDFFEVLSSNFNSNLIDSKFVEQKLLSDQKFIYSRITFYDYNFTYFLDYFIGKYKIKNMSQLFKMSQEYKIDDVDHKNMLNINIKDYVLQVLDIDLNTLENPVILKHYNFDIYISDSRNNKFGMIDDINVRKKSDNKIKFILQTNFTDLNYISNVMCFIRSYEKTVNYDTSSLYIAVCNDKLEYLIDEYELINYHPNIDYRFVKYDLVDHDKVTHYNYVYDSEEKEVKYFGIRDTKNNLIL